MCQFSTNVSEQVKMLDVSRDLGQHNDAWIVLLRNEMTMRCNVVVLQRLNMHAQIACVAVQV